MNQLKWFLCLTLADLKTTAMMLSTNACFTKTNVLCHVVSRIVLLILFSQASVGLSHQGGHIDDATISPCSPFQLHSDVEYFDKLLDINIEISNSGGTGDNFVVMIQNLTTRAVELGSPSCLRCFGHTKQVV